MTYLNKAFKIFCYQEKIRLSFTLFFSLALFDLDQYLPTKTVLKQVVKLMLRGSCFGF